MCFVCFFKQKTAYEMRIRDWSSDVCSSDLSRMVEPMTMVGLWRIQSSRGLRGTEVVSVVAVIASVPDTRIEEGVADVDQQVHQHLGPRKQDDQPLDDRVVALQDRVHRQPSEADRKSTRLNYCH